MERLLDEWTSFSFKYQKVEMTVIYFLILNLFPFSVLDLPIKLALNKYKIKANYNKMYK